MPGQKIEYTFTGNTSNLNTAINSAIRMLDRYKNAVSGASKTSSLGGSLKSVSNTLDSMQSRLSSFIADMSDLGSDKALGNFQSKFKETANSIDSVVNKFKNIGDMGFAKSEEELSNFINTVKKVDNLLGSMTERTTINSQQVGAYTTNLGKLNSELKLNSEAFTSSMAKTDLWHKAMGKIQGAATNISESFRNMFKPFTQAAQNFASVSDSKVGHSLQSAIDHFKSLSRTSTDTSGTVAASFSKLTNNLGETAHRIQQVIYKFQNYDRVQREVAKNQAAHAKSLERISNYSGKGRKPTEVPLLSENEIIDQLISKGAGKGILDFSVNFNKFTRPLTSVVTKVMKGLSSAGSGISAVFSKLGTTVKTTASTLGVLSTKTNVATAGFRGLLGVTKLLPSLFSTIASQILQLSIGNILADATNSAIGLVENLNLFTVSMGQAADQAQEFIDTMSEMYGMNPSNLYRYAGYFAQITGAIGLTDEAAMKLSTSMTKMSNDIASLYNVEIEQVVENLGSGLQGLNQAVRKYGIDMRQTTVQQTAFKYGLTQNVATMSEANRVVLRYLTMYEQMRNAIRQSTTDITGASRVIGDFARNIETPANQLRILKEQVQQLAIAIGTFLIPVVQRLLPILNGIVMAVRIILEFFAQLFGIDALSWGGEISAGADLGAGGLDDLGDSAENAAKKVKDLLAPFDELHILNADVNSGSGTGSDLSDWGELDPRLLKALEDLQIKLDEIRMKAHDVRDAILEIFGLTPDGELIVGGFLDRIIKAFKRGNYIGVGREIANLFNKAIDWALENITWDKLGDSIKHALDIITGIFNGFIDAFNFYGLGNVIANIINIITHTLEEAIDRIDWARLGQQLANGFNGLFENIEWDTAFRMMAKGMNAVYTSLLAFTITLKWKAIAEAIVDGLNQGIKEWNPSIFAVALMTAINGAISMLEAFAFNFDFKQLTNKIFEALAIAIQGIEWYKLGESLTTGFMRAVEAFNASVSTYGDLGISDAIIAFLKGIFESIKPEEFKTAIVNLMRGILNFFVKFREEFDVREMATEFALWLMEVIDAIDLVEIGKNISKLIGDIIGGFVDAFKIRSKEGKPDLIQQFFDFIAALFEEFDWEALGYLIGDFTSTLLVKIVNFFKNPKTWGGFVKGFVSGMIDGFKADPEAFRDLLYYLGAAIAGVIIGIPPQLLPAFTAFAGSFLVFLQEAIYDPFIEFFESLAQSIAGAVLLAIGDIISLIPGEIGKWGESLKQMGRDLMDSAWEGANESNAENAPKTAKDLSDETAKILNDLETQLNSVTVIVSDVWEQAAVAAQKGVEDVAGVVSTHIAEMIMTTNEDLNAWIVDMNGNWHQMQIDASEGIGGVVQTVNTAMSDMSDEALNKSEEIRKNMVDKLQLALSQIEGLEWERTGTEGIAKLKGGIETEWGNLDVFIDTATGQIVGYVERALDNPSYSTLANNLVTLFKGTFATLQGAATGALAGLQTALDQSKSLVNGIQSAVTGANAAIQNTQNKISTIPTQMATTNSSVGNQAVVLNTPNNISTSFKSAREALSSGKYKTTTVNGQTVYKNPDGTTGKTWSVTGQKFYAKGGIVTGPTNAVIGEGGYSEAVIPLEGSPQMQELVQSIADAVHDNTPKGFQNASQPIELTVKVQIGDTEWDSFVYESAQRGEKNVGANPVEVTS